MQKETLDYLIKLYFDRIAEVGFTKYVKECEGYKFDFVNHFQNNFDINATDFHKMLEEALLNNNLTGGKFYFPKQTILNFLKIDELKIKNAFINLFDENNFIVDRIDNFKQVFDEMMAEENKNNNGHLHTFIDLRFISLLLASMYPDDYYYIMITPFKRVGKYLDINIHAPRGASYGEKYRILARVADKVRDIIIKLPEIKKVHDGFIDHNNRETYKRMLKDDKYCWTIQDFIWITGRKLDKSKDPISDPVLA